MKGSGVCPLGRIPGSLVFFVEVLTYMVNCGILGLQSAVMKAD